MATVNYNWPTIDPNATVNIPDDVNGLAAAIDTSMHDLRTDTPNKNHAAVVSDYGLGTSNLFGHVKLSDEVSGDFSAAQGVAATPKAIYDNNISANLSKRDLTFTLHKDFVFTTGHIQLYMSANKKIFKLQGVIAGNINAIIPAGSTIFTAAVPELSDMEIGCGGLVWTRKLVTEDNTMDLSHVDIKIRNNQMEITTAYDLHTNTGFQLTVFPCVYFNNNFD